jgi:hypothetical protein
MQAWVDAQQVDAAFVSAGVGADDDAGLTKREREGTRDLRSGSGRELTPPCAARAALLCRRRLSPSHDHTADAEPCRVPVRVYI